MPVIKIALSAAILGATLCAPVVALAQTQTPRYYVGAAFGRMDTDINGASLVGASDKDSGKAWKVYGGWNYNKHIGVEASYVNLGTAKTTGTASGVPTTISTKTDGIGLALVGTMPVNDRLAFFGKAGGFHAYQRNTRSGASASASKDRSFETLIGIGVKYNVTPNFSLRLEGERYGLGSHERALFYSLGAQANF